MKQEHDFEGRIERKKAMIEGLKENTKLSPAIVQLKIREIQTDTFALRLAQILQSGDVTQGMIDAAARYRLSEGRSERGRADANGTFKAMIKQLFKEVEG